MMVLWCGEARVLLGPLISLDRWSEVFSLWVAYKHSEEDDFGAEFDDFFDLSLKMMEVEVNLEFFRCLNLDSWSNEDLNDVWEDKLNGSDANLLSFFLE